MKMRLSRNKNLLSIFFFLNYLFAPPLYAVLPQQFLYFFPLPQGHGSFLPAFGASLRACGIDIF